MNRELLSKPRLIRFTETQDLKLEALSKELDGIPVTDLVRSAVDLFLLRYSYKPPKEKDGQPTRVDVTGKPICPHPVKRIVKDWYRINFENADPDTSFVCIECGERLVIDKHIGQPGRAKSEDTVTIIKDGKPVEYPVSGMTERILRGEFG